MDQKYLHREFKSNFSFLSAHNFKMLIFSISKINEHRFDYRKHHIVFFVEKQKYIFQHIEIEQKSNQSFDTNG